MLQRPPSSARTPAVTPAHTPSYATPTQSSRDKQALSSQSASQQRSRPQTRATARPTVRGRARSPPPTLQKPVCNMYHTQGSALIRASQHFRLALLDFFLISWVNYNVRCVGCLCYENNIPFQKDLKFTDLCGHSQVYYVQALYWVVKCYT